SIAELLRPSSDHARGDHSICPVARGPSEDRKFYGAGAAVAAFQCSTTDAVVLLSVFLNPGTGAFEYRSRYPILSARCAFIAACAVSSSSERYADAEWKSG